MNFTFLNIPVRIEPPFWLMLFFFSDMVHDPSIESVIYCAIIFVSFLVHEYGHALTAAYYGFKPSVTLHGLGGYASYRNGNESKWQSFIITLNGPLSELILLIIPSYLLLKSGIFSSSYTIQYTLAATMYLNIYWSLINLIPVYPLDGYRLLNGILEYLFGEKGYKASLLIGLLSVAFFVPYLYLKGPIFFPVLLLVFGYQNYQQLLYGRYQGDVSPFNLYMKGVKAMENNDLVEAKSYFKRLLKCKDKGLKHSAIESLAKIYCQENKSHKSYKLLLKADPQLLQEGKTLLCKLAFERKNHELVGKYAHDIYHLEPSYETAILNSQAFACMNKPELAGGWMATASKFGIEYNDKVKELLKHAMYDAVRDQEAFQKALISLDS